MTLDMLTLTQLMRQHNHADPPEPFDPDRADKAVAADDLRLPDADEEEDIL